MKELLLTKIETSIKKHITYLMNRVTSDREYLAVWISYMDRYLDEESESLNGIAAIRVKNLAAVIRHLKRTIFERDEEAIHKMFYGVRKITREERMEIRTFITNTLGEDFFWTYRDVLNELLKAANKIVSFK